MKKIIGLVGAVVVILGSSGCVVDPGYHHAGVSVGVYDEYPRTYRGRGAYYPERHYRWHHPYDRDRYFYRY